MKTKQAAFRVAGILIALSLASGAQAEDVALAAPTEPVAIAQTESAPVRVAQTGNSRPVTLDDLLRFEERMNERIDRMEQRMDSMEQRMDRMEQRMDSRMDRMEDKIDTQGQRLDLALTIMLGGLLGLVTALIVILLPRREKPAAPTAPPPPVHMSRNPDKTSLAPAH